MAKQQRIYTPSRSPSGLTPLLKWPGGKSGELPIIRDNLPSNFDNFYEPFLGGGAVYWDISASQYYVNDFSKGLVSYYQYIKSQNQEFFDFLNRFDRVWADVSETVDTESFKLLSSYLRGSDASQLLKTFNGSIEDMIEGNLASPHASFKRILQKFSEQKLSRIRKIENSKGSLSSKDVLSNIETIIKGSLYTYLREIYNKLLMQQQEDTPEASALFFIMREYAYAAMFRFNASGEFNVPYGGISYNRKRIDLKLLKMQSFEVTNKLADTTVLALDFEDFLAQSSPKKDDFIFLDPPYDTEFSTYDNNPFDQKEQVRLANYLKEKNVAKFMLIIKDTDFIRSLYEKHFFTSVFDKKYLWTIKERNNRDTQHLIIKNY